MKELATHVTERDKPFFQLYGEELVKHKELMAANIEKIVADAADKDFYA